MVMTWPVVGFVPACLVVVEADLRVGVLARLSVWNTRADRDHVTPPAIRADYATHSNRIGVPDNNTVRESVRGAEYLNWSM